MVKLTRLPSNPEDNGWTQSRKDQIEFWTIVVTNYKSNEIQEFKEIIEYDANLKEWQDNYDV